MKQKAPRVTLRIDRVNVDDKGFDRAALEAALRRELGQALARRAATDWSSRKQGQIKADLQPGSSPIETRVARIVARTVTK